MRILTEKFDFIMLELLIVLMYCDPIADLFPSSIQIVVFAFWSCIICREKWIWVHALKLSSVNIAIFIFLFLRCVQSNQIGIDYFNPFNLVISRYQFMIFPILYVYVYYLRKEKKEKLFYLSINCILCTVIVSLYYIFFVDPQAIRNTRREFPLFGVGDFTLMYAIAILMGPLIFLILERIKKKKESNYLIFAATLMFLCLVLCNLVTSVVVATISIFITLFVIKKQKWLFQISMIFTGCLYMFRYWIVDQINEIVKMNLFYWSTNNKIKAIANLLGGDFEHIDTLSSRIVLANYSLQAFVENPIIGIDLENHKQGIIGCHMQWADDLGRYGILGNIILWLNYIYIARYMIVRSSGKLPRDCMIAAWLVFFILGFLNPCISGDILMVIFIVIPAFEGMV